MSAHENFPTFPDQPLSEAEVNARLAQYGVALRPSPKGNWPAGWLPGDEPVQIELEADSFLPPLGGGTEVGGYGGSGDVLDCGPRTPIPNPFPQEKGPFDVLHPATIFDVQARVRFLDALAVRGNASAAAGLVGVSRETVYRARRRYPDFARLWDAALVHARARSEDELASCAFDGVATPVFVRGEHVATFRKKDPRYLLAHLARLDRRIAEAPDAVQRAQRFDQLLAAMAGHEPLEDFTRAIETARWQDRSTPGDLPPDRDEYRMHARCEAMLSAPGELEPEERERHEQDEAQAMADAEAAAGKAWDAWDAAGMELLDRMVAGTTGICGHGAERAGDSVRCVNTGP